ncbi:HMA2 domain-containing protein [Leptodesmis sp.]|uniref:HMA2 domain-containing protein n=1 Tax=Leptodesmis sp. TaxID=3100501 RepID=UPI00405349A0
MTTLLHDRHTHIVSSTPSRTRIRVSAKRRTPEQMGEITRALQAMPDVYSVRPNLQTGSIIIHYDQTPTVVEDLAATLHDVGVILFNTIDIELPATGGKSGVADDLVKAVADLNRRVGASTEGSIDLRFLIPLGLGGLAIYQLLRKGWQFETAPWYVLAYYAFDSFIKLHYTTEPEGPSSPELNGQGATIATGERLS